VLWLWTTNPRLAALAGPTVSSARASTHPESIAIALRRVLGRVLGALSAE
jgi:hypothetical protein